MADATATPPPLPPPPAPGTVTGASRLGDTVTAIVQGEDGASIVHTLVDGAVYTDARRDIGRQLEKMGMYTPGDPTADIRAAFEAAIGAALGSQQTQLSMTRYADVLAAKRAGGTALTAEETADVAMFAAIDAWETGMIAAREAAIKAGTPIDMITWPKAPDGLEDFLSGF